MNQNIDEVLLTELEKVLSASREDILNIENFNDYGMDSLGFALVINSVEDEFNLEFKAEDLEFKKIKNYKLLKTFVEGYIINSKNDNSVSPPPS